MKQKRMSLILVRLILVKSFETGNKGHQRTSYPLLKNRKIKQIRNNKNMLFTFFIL